MAVVGTAVMVIEINITVISASVVQKLVHGENLNKLENQQTLENALWLTSIINL
jgi:hypothetical protein